MKIYTKTGDAGETSLFSGGRRAKHDPVMEAIGTADELNAVLGVLATEPLDRTVAARLLLIQRTLFDVGAALADAAATAPWAAAEEECRELEAWIDEMETELKPLGEFIVPGGSRAAALAHLGRAVCRRAERRVVQLLSQGYPPATSVLPYLNRLSDALFVCARLLNSRLGLPDVPRRPPADGGRRG